MIDLSYSLTIEATEDPSFFGFYSPDLEDQGLPIPAPKLNPRILIGNLPRRDAA